MSVIIIGDLMFDHYVYGETNKIANEAPIPVLLKNREKWNLGGCGNVASNIASLMEYENNTSNVYLLSVSGNDYKEYWEQCSISKNLNPIIITSNDRKTTIKHRFYNHNYLMFRYDEESMNTISSEIVDKLIYEFENLLSHSIQSVIFSDYNKGVLTQEICQKIINICNLRGIPTIVDPKDNFEKYTNCSVIKPNLKETITYLGVSGDFKNLLQYHSQICQQIKAKYSMITLSDKGLSLYDSINSKIYSSNVDSKEVIDVTGAGDIVNAVLGYYWNKISFDEISRIANSLATISVQHSGSYTVTKNDIFSAIRNKKLIDFEELNLINRKDKKLVFTNGCFDLLHLGHLESLKFAKKQGDILIVGVNSDASVKNLKGETRPIQNQKTRSSILCNLECVDYVIIFNEETPLKIIEKLKPDCLVKGSDYEGKKVVGSEFCQEVKLFEYIPGISTTNTIKILCLNNGYS